MIDIWIKHVIKKEEEYGQYLKKLDKECEKRELIAQKTKCQNCGKTPAYPIGKFEGYYNRHLENFEATLCKECKDRLDTWYYPENP